MVSPANTWPGLTQGTKVPAEPSKYYPTGTRNYARVVAPDNFQGPALAQTAQGLGVKSVYILNDKQAYGAGVATYFEDAAKKLGIKVLGNSAYNTKTGTNYQALFQGIAAKHPDAIMVGGLICENGGQLIKDKVAVLGDNTQGEAAPAGRLHDVRRRSPTPARRPTACTRPSAGVPDRSADRCRRDASSRTSRPSTTRTSSTRTPRTRPPQPRLS